MTDHGVTKYYAEQAYNAVHTTEHEAVARQRRELLQKLTGAGISQENLVREISNRLAARVSIAAGPEGPYTSGPAWGGGPLPVPGGPAELGRLISGWKPQRQKAAMAPKPKTEAAPTPAPAAPISAPQPTEAEPRETPNFETHDDVHSWAKDRFPDAKVNLEGIPVQSWQEIAKEVDHVLKQWPGIADRMREFGILKDAPPEMVAAAVIRSGKSLQFNPVVWKNINKLSEQYAKDAKSGWAPKGTGFVGAKFYVTHELGHLVDGYLREFEPATRHRLDLLVGHQPDPNHPHVEFNKAAARTISEYAETSHAEAFAEAFASARWLRNPKNAIVQEFEKVLNP